MKEMTKPVATPQQVRALQLANRVRHARSELKLRVADGEIAAAEVLLVCPSEVARMPVVQLLASQRGWGQARCRALLARIAIREDKSIGSLTERQRRMIAALLTDLLARARLDQAAAVDDRVSTRAHSR